MNSQRITGLALATSGTDLMSRNAGDARYYQSTTPLDAITDTATDLDINGNKITALGSPSAEGHMANKQYADAGVAGVRQDRIQN